MSKPIRRHNRSYSGGYPLAVGDRYYAQDLFRDHAYLESMVGISYNDLVQRSAPFIINGLVASQGTGHTMDITAGKAIVPFTVTIPDTAAAWTIPPSTTTGNINMIIDYAGGTSLSLAGTVTDGATPNYVKLAYTETNGNTRNRAKKTGSYAYEVYDTVTVTIDDTAPTGTELKILTFTTDGATVTITDNGDTRIGSPFHMFDAVVYDQTSFNNIIRRVAANQYKIRDDITSLYCANLSGGYLMTGGTSPLAGGDSWGYIETNNCKNIVFEPGATIHMGNERGYLEVNTDYCRLDNVYIIGTGTVASAVVQSFYQNADYVVFMNCITTDRLSNTSMSAFKGNASTNGTCKYFGCLAKDIASSSGLNGYELCLTLENCISSILDSGGGSGFASCDNLVNCKAEDLDSSSGQINGFYQCDNLENCIAIDIDSSADHAFGFYSCQLVSNCRAEQIDHSGSVAAKNAYGFLSCTRVSNCYAYDIDTNGAGGYGYGYNNCNYISTSSAISCVTGYDTCSYISSSYAATCSGNGFSSCSDIVCSSSTGNTGYGFNSCYPLANNRATGNTAGQYNANCYANWGASVAVADTATGGYNG